MNNKDLTHFKQLYQFVRPYKSMLEVCIVFHIAVPVWVF